MSRFVLIGEEYHNVDHMRVVDQETMDKINALGHADHAIVAHLKWLVRASFEEGFMEGQDASESWRDAWNNSKAKEYLG